MKASSKVGYSRSTVIRLVAILLPSIWLFLFISTRMHSQASGRAIVFASLGALGWLACVGVYSLISGRILTIPTGMAVLLSTSNVANNTDKPTSTMEHVSLLIALQFCLVLMFALWAAIVRVWLREKSDPTTSPLADAEIDARPIV